MLFKKALLSCLLVGAANVKALQPTLTEGTLIGRTAANSPQREVGATKAAAPSPTQPGLISTCNAYYRVQRGDYCATVVDKFYGLTLNEFYVWNPRS
uniref:LysM domain-containing protein n=1 Tax=Talaromyces marneffei PM1 TaxID=1077442 RepID=A0A093XFR9_TALMA